MSSLYYNSSIKLPNTKNSQWVAFYIGPASSTDIRNNEVLQQIIDYYPTLKSSFAQIAGIYAGSLLRLPVRWSPVYAPYVKKVTGNAVIIDGFAPNMDSTIYWITMPVERPERDALNTINSSRVRYLVGC